MNPFDTPALFAATALALSLLVGCSDGGGTLGDMPSKPLASEYGPGVKLCKAIGPATWLAPPEQATPVCSYPPVRQVYATGVSVVAIDRYDETGDGATGNYYVQDSTCAGAPYSGVTVYNPSFSPPDLRLAENDVVDMAGELSEFIGPSSSPFPSCRTLPEVAGTLTFRFDGNDPAQATPITVADLVGYENARKWLGMLVKVENVGMTANISQSKGRWSIDIYVDAGGNPVAQEDIPKITNELYDLPGAGPVLQGGESYKSVTGIVTYFYGFHLAPRSAADFEK